MVNIAIKMTLVEKHFATVIYTFNSITTINQFRPSCGKSYGIAINQIL